MEVEGLLGTVERFEGLKCQGGVSEIVSDEKLSF